MKKDSSEKYNPAVEEMEESNEEINSSSKNSPISDIAKAIEIILSEEHQDQKTKITAENEDGLICIDVLQAHFLKSFKYSFPSLKALKESKQEHALSVDGFRSNQIVEIFKSIQTNIVTGDVPLGKRLMGNR